MLNGFVFDLAAGADRYIGGILVAEAAFFGIEVGRNCACRGPPHYSECFGLC